MIHTKNYDKNRNDHENIIEYDDDDYIVIHL